MFKIKDEDLDKIREVLSNIYIDNGNTEEVILLSQAIDKIILSKQKTMYLDYMNDLSNDVFKK
ncbi:hypothetical protein [Clostridium cuniculi]|uniref:hypothetical protein n=1 Tax=Clostridium cuniculi TaxID=2548455 RepID=UPI0010558681|nr:hypothetical protein [Clostridium cuniculi]